MMKDEVFDKVLKGAREAVAIEKGERRAARISIFFTKQEIKKIRARLHMTQKQFADQFGLPVETIRHWEQGLRTPGRPAMALLNIIDKQPEAAIAAFS